MLGSVVLLMVAGCTGYLPQGRTMPGQLSQAVIVQKVNAVRAAYGRPPLQYDPRLASAAQRQADLMAKNNKLSHDLGETLRQRVRAAGFEGAVGEDVAEGAASLEQALTGWLKSAAHQHILLSEKFTGFGLGVAMVGSPDPAGRGTYWSIVLGGQSAPWLSGGR